MQPFNLSTDLILEGLQKPTWCIPLEMLTEQEQAELLKKDRPESIKTAVKN